MTSDTHVVLLLDLFSNDYLKDCKPWGASR